MAEKGGKAPSKKAGKGIHSLYTVSGNKLERKNKYCPKCGQGFFLAKHKDRQTCGNCHYTEFSGKK
ncbi:MAG: small subunit ribosomal protein S27Ae [archaeon GW2011_AR3]|nr:MAG: small subunit ribosomal protein S27Ae [archaeon GW2011_AR3]MBS3109032.1 30S ribosomal protein S27ae [Candidatus Woesearchaeota archaeon]